MHADVTSADVKALIPASAAAAGDIMRLDQGLNNIGKTLWRFDNGHWCRAIRV